MKTNALFVAAGLLAAFASSTHAHSVVYEAKLLGINELPSPAATPGSGTATVTLDEHAMTLRVQADFKDLVGNVTAAHIHCCTAQAGTGTAGVASLLPSFPGFPQAKAGTYDQTFDLSLASNWNGAFINTNGGNVTSAFAALSAGLAQEKAYFNIHSSAFPGGEIRGTLVSAVPEPASMGLFLLGLLPLAGLMRHRAVRSK